MRRAICSEVCRVLREGREKRGMSMTTLAQRAGLSQSMISFVEREIRNPSLETLLRITEVLGISLGAVIEQAYTAAKRKAG